MSGPLDMLRSHLAACGQRIDKLRYKFSHHYPELSEARLQRLNLVIREAEFLVSTFASIVAYLVRKGYLVPD